MEGSQYSRISSSGFEVRTLYVERDRQTYIRAVDRYVSIAVSAMDLISLLKRERERDGCVSRRGFVSHLVLLLTKKKEGDFLYPFCRLPLLGGMQTYGFHSLFI